MDEKHQGGCFCGKLRYETVGEPVRTAVCHCRYCQLRTGTAFGISVYFNTNQVSFNDALFLLRERGKAMQNAVPVGEGAMLAILGIKFDAVELEFTEFKSNEIVSVNSI